MAAPAAGRAPGNRVRPGAGRSGRFSEALGIVESRASGGQDWTESEPGFRELVDEIRRLVRRGRKKWWLAVLLTLLATGAIVARQARSQRRYPARVVLGVTENASSEESPVHSSVELKNYVFYAVFTDSALMKVIEKYHYDDKLLAKQPRLVLEDFRDTVEVDVAKNEFAAPRMPGETRSAIVSVELWLPDPEQAIQITRELGDLVIQRDEQNQHERLKLERNIASNGVAIVQNEIDRMERELASANQELEDADPNRRAELTVTIDNLTRSLLPARTRLDAALRKRRDLDEIGAAGERSMALKWDRVDWGVAALRVNERMSLAEVGIGSLLVMFPLLLLGVGAFNRRVYDDRDVEWLGHTALGVIQTRGKHG
ncbi:MAG: hypothetical protein U0414_33395 [Polyangiaceae bacterium]